MSEVVEMINPRPRCVCGVHARVCSSFNVTVLSALWAGSGRTIQWRKVQVLLCRPAFVWRC